MRIHPPHTLRNSALTLPELLTIIAVILILLGLFFPCIHCAGKQAAKVRAKSDLMATVAAVKQYYAEYGEYPSAGQAPNMDITFGNAASGAASPVSNEALYNILRNYPGMKRPTPDGNSKQIVFIEGKNAIGTPANPKGGFATSSTGGTGAPGAFYDPWGNQYAITIDGNYDSHVSVPYWDVMKASANGLNSGCAAWSVGKDGKLGNKGDKLFKNARGSTSDDVVSWE
jgi:Tfp pilus assembly protein PilE